MKKLFTLIALFATGATAHAQFSSQNITLLDQWDSTQIPQENTYHIRYNGIWGWVDPQDNREYAIIGSTEGTHFIDVTNPTNVIQRDFVAGRRNQCIWREYKTYQNYCYMVSDDGAPNSMQIIDMSYLPDSVHVVYDDNQLITQSHTLFIDGDKLYFGYPKGASVGGTSRMAIFSLANPQLPSFLRTIEQDFSSGIDIAHDMFVRNDTIYASMSYTGLFMFRYNSNNTFSQIGSLTSYANQGYNHSSALTANGDLLIFCDEVPAGLPIKALDVTNFSNLNIFSQFRSTTSSTATPHNPFIRANDNSRLIMAYYQDGVQVFDITNPSNVVRTGYFDTNPNDCPSCPNPNYSGCWGAYVDLPSGIIIASDMQNGLFVLDANNALTTHDEASNYLSHVSVYPNPSSGHFSLALKMKSADLVKSEILDLAGRVVYTTIQPVSEGSSTIGLQTEGLDAGIYMIRVSGTDFSHTEKLILEN
jgi:choice-of-anchor B domain-containing protein